MKQLHRKKSSQKDGFLICKGVISFVKNIRPKWDVMISTCYQRCIFNRKDYLNGISSKYCLPAKLMIIVIDQALGSEQTMFIGLVWRKHFFVLFFLSKPYVKTQVFKFLFCLKDFTSIYSAGIYHLKVNNRNTRAKCELCLKFTIETSERRHWRVNQFLTINPFKVTVPIL